MARQGSSSNQPGTAPKRRRRQDGETQLLRFLLKLTAAAVVGWTLLTYVLGIYVVHSNDMFPALRDGDLCITWKLRKPVYGEIVSYNYDGVRRFGRVVGMPGDVIDFAGEEIQVLETPGHSAGSLSFYCPSSSVIFTGDAVFQSSIGRTDLPGGSFPVLIDSINTKIMTLPADTVIASGHGDTTTVGDEKVYNPYLA